jgi:hypothetical protein
MNRTKYQKATMPTPEEALGMAREREEWAKDARERDLTGTAHEYELTALLLRFYAGSVAGSVNSRDDGTVVAVGGEPGANTGDSE